MRRNTIFLSVAAGAIAISGLITYFIGRNDASEHQSHKENSLEYYEREKELAKAGGSVAISPSKQVRRESISEVIQADPRLIALSEPEADWMRKHGYPTLEEIRSIGTTDLRGMAGANTPREATLYGLSLLKEGNTAGGVAILERAAALGSIYAYEEAAIADYNLVKSRTGDSSINDNVLAAKLEVAKILGDYRADDLAKIHLPNHSIGIDASTKQQQTTEFLRQLGDNSQALGVAAPGPDPRPNLKRWNELQARISSGEAKEELIEIFW